MTRRFLFAIVAFALALAFASLACGCKKASACRGEISQDDMVRLQARADKGEKVCDELTRATVKVDDEGVLLNGARIHVILEPGKKGHIPPLEELLRKDREIWKTIHPGSSFDSLVEVHVPAETDVGPGVTVASTLADTGYRTLNVHSGDITMKLDYWVRSGPDADPRELVHVEYDDKTRVFTVRFGGEPTVRTGHRHKVSDRAEAAKAIASEWAGPPGELARGLILRVPNGTFHDALALARGFLALPELAGATVAFEVGAP